MLTRLLTRLLTQARALTHGVATDWFASRMVAGSLTHTLAVPTCAHADDSATLADTAALPSFADLDRDIAQVGPNGSRVDVVGSRYWRAGSRGGDPPWRTAEVVRLEAGDSYVFAPSWFRAPRPVISSDPHAVSLRPGGTDAKRARAAPPARADRVIPPAADQTRVPLTLVAKLNNAAFPDLSRRGSGPDDRSYVLKPTQVTLTLTLALSLTLTPRQN